MFLTNKSSAGMVDKATFPDKGGISFFVAFIYVLWKS